MVVSSTYFLVNNDLNAFEDQSLGGGGWEFWGQI